MWENLNPAVEVVEGKLMFANFSLVANWAVASKLPILCLLQKPT